MSDDEEDDTPIFRLASVEMCDSALGNEVAKDFGEHGVFHGEVVEFDREGGDGTEEHYHVDWEDNNNHDNNNHHHTYLYDHHCEYDRSWSTRLSVLHLTAHQKTGATESKYL